MGKQVYYHFSNGFLAYGDKLPIEPGYIYHEPGEPVLCQRGLHASKRPIDALRYAPGFILSKVYLSGEVIRGNDKSVATHREVIAVANVEHILREFARKCALDVIHLWDAPNVVVRYLETGDESLRDAALDAARAAAWAAAAAARAAARAAAWDATGAAARDAARDGQNKRLLKMIAEANWRI